MSTATPITSTPGRNPALVMIKGVTTLQGIFRGRSVRRKYDRAKQEEMCTICFEDFHPSHLHIQKKEVLTSCFHRMHQQCLGRSIQQTGIDLCPTCRTPNPLSQPPFQHVLRVRELERKKAQIKGEAERILQSLSIQEPFFEGLKTNAQSIKRRVIEFGVAGSLTFMAISGTALELNIDRIAEIYKSSTESSNLIPIAALSLVTVSLGLVYRSFKKLTQPDT